MNFKSHFSLHFMRKTRYSTDFRALLVPAIRHPDGIREWKLNAAYRIFSLGIYPITLVVLLVMIGFGRPSLALLLMAHLGCLALACLMLTRGRLLVPVNLALASSSATAFLYLIRIGQPDGLYFLSFVIIFAGIFIGVRAAFGWAALNSAIIVAASFRIPGYSVFPKFPEYFLHNSVIDVTGFYISTIVFLFFASAFLSILFQSYFSDLLTTIKRTQDERLLLETELLQAQKMEAMGLLASGIAHEFGHSLTRIKSCANLIRKKLPDSHADLFKYADAILASCDQTVQSSGKLLSFTRKRGPETVLLSVHDLLETVLNLLHYTAEKDIQLRTDFAAQQFTVRGSFSNLQGVLMNLAKNAIDAIEQKGTIAFTTHCESRALDGAGSAPCIIITVIDDGAGIDEAIRHRIFEPFFTTKSPREGNGLGLALAVRIVRNHGGAVECESEKGNGTRFRILLPLAQTSGKQL